MGPDCSVDALFSIKKIRNNDVGRIHRIAGVEVIKTILSTVAKSVILMFYSEQSTIELILTGDRTAGPDVSCWVAAEGGQCRTTSVSSRHSFVVVATLALPSFTDDNHSSVSSSSARNIDFDRELR